jgi:hypothetical protein
LARCEPGQLSNRDLSCQRLAIDPLDGLGAEALDDREGLLQHRHEIGPGRAKALIDAARTPFFGALAKLIWCEEPGRSGARQIVGLGRVLMGHADPAAIDETIAEMTMQPAAQFGIAGHIDKGGRLLRRQRLDTIIWNYLVIAAERRSESGVAAGRETDNANRLAPGMQQMGQTEGGLAGRTRQDHLTCAEELCLGEKIIDEE